MFSLHFRVCRFPKGIGGRGRPRRSGALLEPPCQPGAGGTSAALTRGRSPPPTAGVPRPPGEGDVSSALGRGRGPLAHRGLLADVPLWRVAVAPLPTGGQGHAPLWHAAGAPLLKQFLSNINQNCIWLIFDIKCQPKLYLVDV